VPAEAAARAALSAAAWRKCISTTACEKAPMSPKRLSRVRSAAQRRTNHQPPGDERTAKMHAHMRALTVILISSVLVITTTSVALVVTRCSTSSRRDGRARKMASESKYSTHGEVGRYRSTSTGLTQ